jgi:hypothetical protein
VRYSLDPEPPLQLTANAVDRAEADLSCLDACRSAAMARTGTGLSNTTLAQTLKPMNRGDVTAHGFRSTFRD